MIGNIFAKLFDSLLEMKLNNWCEATQTHTFTQVGFRFFFNTIDHILCLHVLYSQSKSNGKTLFATFIDFRNVFDIVDRKLLWNRLDEFGVPKELMRAVFKLYQQV